MIPNPLKARLTPLMCVVIYRPLNARLPFMNSSNLNRFEKIRFEARLILVFKGGQRVSLLDLSWVLARSACKLWRGRKETLSSDFP